jgi:hypothetical protein
MPLWIALALGGCAAVSTPETQISASRTRFESALISYRTDPVSAEPAPAKPAAGVQLAAFFQPPPAAGKLTRLLQIQYPHPAGRAGYARVELILGSAGAKSADGWPAQFRRALRENMPGMSNAEGIAEAWALDVPAGEIDRILERLEEQGYFTAGTSQAAGTSLTAKIDGNEFQRPWHRSGELEALSLRVRREGKLVSHRQPLEPAPLPTQPLDALPAASAAAFMVRLPPVEPADGR